LNRPQSNLDLAVVGNCEIAALIDDKASVVWACLPKLDADPVFCSLLRGEETEDSTGIFAIDLRNQTSTKRRYVRNTAILESLLEDANGNGVRVTDFCPRFPARGRMHRPMMLIRLLEPVAGRPLVRIRLRPSAVYGSQAPQRSSGSHHVRFSAPDLSYRLTTDASISAICGEQWMILDRPRALILGPDQTIEEAPLAMALQFLNETRRFWEGWVRGLATPPEWQEAVIRSAITLKLCTFEDTGAVVAALTTSIPEHAGSGRNWDYRYCWIRDSYFVVQALNSLGTSRTMEDYLHYIDQIVARSNGARLQPLFSISGEVEVPERTAPALPGYRGMGPVRVGNHAYLQRQNDVYGAIVLAAAQLFFDERLANPGDAVLFDRLQRFGELAAKSYEEPDAGPWEFRGREQPHTFSAVMSWAGCDRLRRVAARLGLQDRKRYWGDLAAAMHERILQRAWNEELGAFTSSFDGTDLDATALLMPELGFLPGNDPKFISTLGAIERDLKEGDWLYRYRHHDDFGKPATAFTICAFWYVNALAAAGRREEARDHFERLLGCRNSLGLLSEDIEPGTSELWGNFPQTYSLVGIINCAVRLSRRWEDIL
jgi:GH15 family glucan-1,4-alpha-glucosidase